MRILAAVVLAVALVTGCAGSAAAPSPSLADIGAGLQGPAGLTATTEASGLANVSAFAFDADGRLWAATASFADDGTDAVYLVPRAGTAPVKVITDVHTPLGLVWDDGTLFVSNGDGIEAYRDLDADTDGFATHAAILTLPAGIGQVNGLALSPDGRLFLGVSAPCDACEPETAAAAAVVSVLPDGTDLRVEAGHIRAPVGLAFYPGTDDLFVTMNQRDDLADATPGDWLAVVHAGQDWGFPDCYGQDAAACRGVPTPVAVLDKHAAVSGVAIVTGGLGGSIGTSAIVAEWATGLVLRVPLATDGTTDTGTAEPFLAGLSKPVPVAVAPDGALFVGDWATGTVYRIRSSAVASLS